LKDGFHYSGQRRAPEILSAFGKGFVAKWRFSIGRNSGDLGHGHRSLFWSGFRCGSGTWRHG
jgi:hypothetical protein